MKNHGKTFVDLECFDLGCYTRSKSIFAHFTGFQKGSQTAEVVMVPSTGTRSCIVKASKTWPKTSRSMVDFSKEPKNGSCFFFVLSVCNADHVHPCLLICYDHA